MERPISQRIATIPALLLDVLTHLLAPRAIGVEFLQGFLRVERTVCESLRHVLDTLRGFDGRRS